VGKVAIFLGPEPSADLCKWETVRKHSSSSKPVFTFTSISGNRKMEISLSGTLFN
jgi:hypothetical protein